MSPPRNHKPLDDVDAIARALSDLEDALAAVEAEGDSEAGEEAVRRAAAAAGAALAEPDGG